MRRVSACASRAEARTFGAINVGGGVTLALPDNPTNDPNGDVVCGYLNNPDDLSTTMTTAGPKYNSVRARTSRTARFTSFIIAGW